MAALFCIVEPPAACSAFDADNRTLRQAHDVRSYVRVQVYFDVSRFKWVCQSPCGAIVTCVAALILGSGLIDPIQKITDAAMQIADIKYVRIGHSACGCAANP